ncbi:glycosyl transferase [Legionella lansingensis]|uniref:Glycosyl transferase n=2 Tax=Legionella lansingensis TaxID=45067 RepID=A0A0W0VKB5_9GAMM|nr:glycosyl transferase [Legionella lansingensis]SNV47695.1 glycosyl transferase [Legionella lansingensis]
MLHTKTFHLNANQQALFYFLLYVCFLIVARVFLCYPILSYDEAEQVFFAQKLSAGYPAQPPFYTWLQWLAFKGMGLNLFSLALVKYTLIGACFYIYHLICRYYCHNSLLAWCATLSWAFIPNISYDFLPHKTHVITALLVSCLTWYWFIKPQRAPKFVWYAGLGLLIGIGILSKFNYLIFLAVLLISALTIQEYRVKVIAPGILISFAIAVFISSPYWVWLIHNASVGLSASYKLVLPEKNQWHGVIRLFAAFLCFIGPLVLIKIFFPLSRVAIVHTPQNQLLWRYHLVVFPFLVLFVIASGMNNVRTHWVLPILFLTPVWFFHIVDIKKYSLRRARYYLGLCLLVQLGLVSAWIIHIPNSAESPMMQLVEDIKKDHQPVTLVVADSDLLVGNLMLFLGLKDGILIPFMKEQVFPKENMLMVWEGANPPYWVNYLLVGKHPLTKPITTRHENEVMGHAYSLQKDND